MAVYLERFEALVESTVEGKGKSRDLLPQGRSKEVSWEASQGAETRT